MTQFVILRHRRPAGGPRKDHWDLMLEFAGGLRTWALAELPAMDRAIVARRLPDHRLAYLDYEGPISGDRGHVSRWDRGEFIVLADDGERLHAKLVGQRIHGSIELRRQTAETDAWLLTLSGGKVAQ